MAEVYQGPTAWFENNFYALTPEQRAQMENDFRLLFETEVGQRVLAAILGRVLRFFGEADTDETRVLHNAARRLLACLGAWREGDELKIVRRLTARN